MTFFTSIILGGETERRVRSFCELYDNDATKIGDAVLRALKMAKELNNQDGETETQKEELLCM